MAFLSPHFDPDVFLSYSHGDPHGRGQSPLKDWTHKLVQRLEARRTRYRRPVRLATAFVGIRAYAEFALLERESRHMIAVLETARDEVNALKAGPIDAPQGSLHLGRTLYAATT